MSNLSSRGVRFSNGEAEPNGEDLKNHLPAVVPTESADSPPDSQNGEEPHAGELDDELGELGYYSDPGNGPVASLPAGTIVNGISKSQRSSGGGDDAPSSHGNAARPQRPMGPTRTPSNTYNPATSRKPGMPPTTPSFVETMRSASKTRHRQSESRFRAQERAYVQKLRQDNGGEYFSTSSSYQNMASGNDSDSEGDTPSTEGPFDDPYEQETIMFYGNEDLQPSEEDLQDAESRERLEWHGMLEAVLTGDVVRQEKKRLHSSSDEAASKTAQVWELWLGIRSKVCGRHLPVQRRMVEEARAALDRTIDEIINFSVKGQSEVGKPPHEQVKDIVKKIEKCESLYPSWRLLATRHKAADSPLFHEAYDTILAWYNTNEMINTELAILKKWVGNDDLDFHLTKQRSPAVNGISSDETSFVDRLMKEDGLQSLYDDTEGSTQQGMLRPISAIIQKAKETLISNSATFSKRHLPPYLEDLLTLISFPSRLIEEITKTRLAYARRVKETAQQNPLMQGQMIAQFQLLLKFAIRIKGEFLAIAQPEPGWDLPPFIDESLDQVVLDALKYYFKMLNWKLSGNKNTFKEAELLFQEWDFANDIGNHLHRGNIQVAEQFSSLTFKALNRLSQTFEKELQVKPKESPAEMSKRYKACLDSVRIRQRMLQRFTKTLSNNYENASDWSISFSPERMRKFYDQLAATGHFHVNTNLFEADGLYVVASPELRDRLDDIQEMMAVTNMERFPEDFEEHYLLILRPEDTFNWFSETVVVPLQYHNLDIKVGQARLCAVSSKALPNARKAFLEAVDMHVDLVQESRPNIHKVHTKLMEIRRVMYRLSNTFMDSVEAIRRQVEGKGCQELVQTCFLFATEFGRRSLVAMDSNRRQMNNLKLTKLALDWVSFICDDCIASDRKTFRWAVQALEFAMGMTHGRHILALGDPEYALLRDRVAGCMSLLISHFDIMGARSNLAAQAEKDRIEALVGQFRRLDKNRMLDDEEASRCITEARLEELERLDSFRREKEAERQALGRVLEANTEADRSLAYLSSSATNITMRWQQGHFVGGGTFGNVYAAMNLDSGHLMAVKEIRLQDPKLIPTVAEQIREEMGVLEVLDHPNVVSYYGIEVHRDRVYIFMEFCSGGSLANLLEHGRIEDEQVIMVYALQLLEGLVYLHESGIAHRDIKPENILLDHNGIIKYVDFGAAKVIARQGRTLAADVTATKPNKSMTGTPMYMSPEVIKGENPGRAGAVDIWSLGCVILEMATGRRPWANLDNEWAIMYNIAQGNPPQLPSQEHLSWSGIDFLKRCFARDPKRRSSAKELLQHEWIMTIRNQVVEPSTPSDGGSSMQSTPITSSSRSSAGQDGFY
ncbi:MAP kinase kinase kinase-like protein [Emericellopsis cladophorae]|uniref:MAP kinase kinase kinase n=1 Tax=Emericellopsis cladophorae TaxID=2686198 RepID=A0A9P9Y542_9HYPO|nr:MAP kinase kinase kinase-like protein [Emericellopsis cladophorae]KAI6783714.1 MAP kinase kinase kinase-like protein [Emericellopsis cladophorae]